MASSATQNPVENNQNDFSQVCATDLSTKMYCAVKVASNLVALAVSGDAAAGILQNKPLGTASAHQIAQVRVTGQTRVKLGGTVTPGAFLKPNTNSDGTLIATATDREIYCAIALEDGVSGDLCLAKVESGTVSHA